MWGAPGSVARVAARLTALDMRLIAAHDLLARPAEPGTPPPPSMAEGGSSLGSAGSGTGCVALRRTPRAVRRVDMRE